jgi:hypothetical protein
VPSLPKSAPGSARRLTALGTFANVVHGVSTCRTCATPVRGFELCWRCRRHRKIAGIADAVAPLDYAIGGTDSPATLSIYKNHPVRAEREYRAQMIAELLTLAIRLHENCFSAVADVPVSVRTVIPSLTYRSGLHPLASITESIGMVTSRVLIPGGDARCDRRVRAGKFAEPAASLVTGRHVLVIDDVWTTGSNAQSAAVALRRAGAAAVSVLVVGRWLNPRDTLTQTFIASRLGIPYDPHLCPVAGGRCPSELLSRSPWAAKERS